ncbi:hypothetical protein pb186bvf_011477 [Paramecium bursaria]
MAPLLVMYALTITNYYCTLFLSYKTCLVFKDKQTEDIDTLLIKWFLFYTFQEFEWLALMFLDLIPFGYMVAFFIKLYIILPHSQWHSKIYNIFEQIEMDDQTNKYLRYVQQIVKIIIIRALKIIETYVDMVRKEDLQEVEEKINQVQLKIISKKSFVTVCKSQIKFKPKNNQTQSVQKLEPYNPQQEQTKYLISKNAVVYDKRISKRYTLVFNLSNSQLNFLNSDEQVVHQRILYKIIPNNDSNDKTLLFEYINAPDNNLQEVKLQNSDDIDNWLSPVIEVLSAQ